MVNGFGTVPVQRADRSGLVIVARFERGTEEQL
jgi:hypothetical protein